MAIKKVQFKNNIKFALAGLTAVLKQPKYLILAVIFGFLMSLIIYFSINYGFYGPLVLAPMPLTAKVSVVNMITINMLESYFTTLTGAVLLALAILQGMALSLLAFNIKQNRQLDSKVVAGSGLAAIAAIIGLGCVPCGTSLLVPIMTLVFASSAPALLSTANLIILIIATILSLYSVYSISRISYTNIMVEKVSKKENGGENETQGK